MKLKLLEINNTYNVYHDDKFEFRLVAKNDIEAKKLFREHCDHMRKNKNQVTMRFVDDHVIL